MSLKKSANRLIGKIVNAVSQKPAEKGAENFPVDPEMTRLCRRAAAESFVLLKNDGGVLPFAADETIAVFGRVQFDSFFVGYGSGGDVNAHYKISFSQGIKNCKKLKTDGELEAIYTDWLRSNPPDDGFWGHWPMCYDEMPVSKELALDAAKRADSAVVIIGRAAGEDRENTLTKGSYYLTDTEEEMLRSVSQAFKKTAVILNIGGIMDLSWLERLGIPCVGICWQGGMEAGNALADILCGDVSPCGRLTDTAPKAYELCPTASNFGGKIKNHYEEDIFVGYRFFETFEKDGVLFPFGHGLSYSEFEFDDIGFEKNGEEITVKFTVKNKGNVASRQVAQLYYSVSGAPLPMPSYQLCSFAKTKMLQPGESERIVISLSEKEFAAFDDCGKTGFENSWVLQKGNYKLRLGESVRNTEVIGKFTVESSRVISRCTALGAPEQSENLRRICRTESGGRHMESVPSKTYSLKKLILDSLPAPMSFSGGKAVTLNDVARGNAELSEFISQLSKEELEALTRGDYVMDSPLGPSGNAGAFGGVLPSLREKGVPPIITTDGPSGIRLSAKCSLLPSDTALACTWDAALVEELYSLVGSEMVQRKTDVLLAPGMNIHRDPLCGRNFEYYSEDPLVTGIMASAAVKGIQRRGFSACPKHFCCNNQETNRTHNNSVLSARALREIYLKGFEICVKTAAPKNIMTSYNKINGVWGHYNYELVTGILRGEWGYTGNVITDWWMRPAVSPEFPKLKNQAYRVRAGVDVLMPGGGRSGRRRPDGTLLKSLGKKDGITMGELQLSAAHVLKTAIEKINMKEGN